MKVQDFISDFGATYPVVIDSKENRFNYGELKGFEIVEEYRDLDCDIISFDDADDGLKDAIADNFCDVSVITNVIRFDYDGVVIYIVTYE